MRGGRHPNRGAIHEHGARDDAEEAHDPVLGVFRDQRRYGVVVPRMSEEELGEVARERVLAFVLRAAEALLSERENGGDVGLLKGANRRPRADGLCRRRQRGRHHAAWNMRR
jgi:hypothetical protein